MKNKLQTSPKVLGNLSLKQTLIIASLGAGIIIAVFVVSFLYFNFGRTEKAFAASQYSSKDNKTELWKDAAAWDRAGTWLSTTPQSGSYWTADIYGVVTYENDPGETFMVANGSSLNINDTLVINGDALFSGGDTIDVAPSGVLIIRGNLSVSGGSVLKNKGRVVVTGNLIADGGAVIQNTANANNGFYLYGVKSMSGGANYGTNYKTEAQLQSNDPALYSFVSGGAGLLPISLFDFTAALGKNNNITVSWSTASEKDNDFFTLEKSVDGKSFETLAIIDGGGNSDQTLTYSFEDRNTVPGMNYYRLKQTDFNGDFEYFKIVAVNNNNAVSIDEKPLKVVKAGPNPFKEYLKITYISNHSESIELLVRSIDGKVVHSEMLTPQIGNNEYTFYQASSLRSGIYIISLNTKGKSEVIKMVKQ